MSSLFELMGPHHEAMVKEAIVGAIAKPMFGGVKKLVSGFGNKFLNKPIQTTLGVAGPAFAAADALSGANRMRGAAAAGEQAARAASNLAN